MKLPAMCADCTRNKGDKCAVLKDPRHFWRKYRGCFAKVTSIDKEAVIEQAIRAYLR